MEVGLVIWWLLLFGLLSVLGYPLAARLFREFPGQGVGFAPAISLGVVTVIAYWVGQIRFGQWVVWLAFAALCVLAAVTRLDLTQLRDRTVTVTSASVPINRRVAIESAAVFVGGFVLIVAIRTADPAINPLAGEKFLDYGLVRTILRAESLPPQDFWFAGEPVRYYYGGHLMTALLTWLTGTDPAFAYNLALAGYYATLMTAVHALAGAVGSHLGGSRRGAAFLGVILVGLSSNLMTAVQTVVGFLPGPVENWLASRVAMGTSYTTAELSVGLSEFSYWSPSRILPGTVNEFPLFAWLNGDLHAHMMAAPFLVVAVAVAFAYWQTPPEALRRRRMLIFGMIPLLGGLQAIMHTWDLPTIFGVVGIALVFAPGRPSELLPWGSRVRIGLRDHLSDGPLAEELRRLGGGVVVTGLAAGGAVLFASPFLIGVSSGRQIGLLAAADRSHLSGLLIVHGAFLGAFGAYLGSRLTENTTQSAALPLIGGVGFVSVTAFLVELPALAVVVPLLIGGWVALRREAAGFETALVIGGAGLVGLVELVYVVELAGPGRFNTVFKVYSQVWLLWGIAASAIMSYLWGQTPTIPALSRIVPASRTRRSLTRFAIALVVISTLPYAALAGGGHFQANDAGTLHGTAYADTRHPADAAAIRWLDANADGDDTLLEAPGVSVSPEGNAQNPEVPGLYTWGANPASSLTGIPTVAGWAHEIGYRGFEPYYERVAAVDRAYAGSDAERVAAITAYNVTHIYVGAAEQRRYGDVQFGQLEGVRLVFERDDVQIYAVDQERLGS